LDNNTFDDCLTHWQESTGNQPFWNDLANKYNYESGEILRSVFKRERKKRGIEKENGNVTRNFDNFPVIGVMDIETLPAIGYIWGLWDQNISLNQLVADSCLLSWAGKYLNDTQIYSDILTSKEAIARNAKRVTLSAFEFVNSCDYIVGHNFRSFDGKILNVNFLLYAKPVKYQVIDTLEIAKNNFRFTSNKLAFINEKLGIRNKIDNDGFVLWSQCSEGNQEALNTMLNYNVGDVSSSEDLYFKLRAFWPSHPNLARYNEIETEQCPCCLSEKLVSEGFYYSGQSKFEKLRCSECGSINRRKKNLLSKNKRSNLLVKI
jgi:hypothetical protein